MKNPLFPLAAFLVLFMLMGPVAISQSFKSAQPYSEKKLLQDFLCSEVVYPDDALEQKIEGKVVMSFIVENDGSVNKVRVKQQVSPELDAEALRLFRMLLWEPAISMGQPVASENEYTINFNIKKYNKHCKQRGYTSSTYPFQPVDSSYIVYEYSQTENKPIAVFDEKGMRLKDFIAKNIKYPETAYRQNLSGIVTLGFVVEPHGRVSNIKVLQDVGGGCNQEAIRLLQMIKWMPGIKDGKAVRTIMNIDIEFRLPEESDMNMFESGQMQSQ